MKADEATNQRPRPRAALAFLPRREGEMARTIVLSFCLTVATVVATSSATRAQTTTTRVSIAASGAQGNGDSKLPSISADGRFIAFESAATTFATGDTNAYQDIYLRDVQAGSTELVSVSTGGVVGNGTSYIPAISADGMCVAFHSDASNLVSDDSNGCQDVFVRNRQAAQTERISVSSSGEQGNSSSAWASISADGRYVAFLSYATNLVPGDTNATQDVFVRDRQLGRTERVSVDSTGAQANGYNGDPPSISADGRYVAFESGASNLVAGDTNGVYDIFVHDRQTGLTSRVSMSTSGTQGNANSWSPCISANGRYVAFHSTASNLVAGDTNGTEDVFVHDSITGTTTRVNVSSDGTQANGQSSWPTISADGRYVAFWSQATNLVAGDTNGVFDDFLRDTVAGTTTRVNVANDGSQANAYSNSPRLSADGRYVAFWSQASNLVTGDTNGYSDTFVRGPLYGIIRVNANAPGPTHDGASWATAYLKVQDGINAAATGDEVWVATGTYVENIVLKGYVPLFGGFAGTETARTQRDWNTNVTVLDGGNNGNYVVMSFVQGASLDGFTARNGTYGVWANSSGSVIATNCLITANSFTGIKAGGNSSVGASTATATNCVITGNPYGVYVNYGTANIANCTIVGNTYGVSMAGGATAVTNCIAAFNGTGISRDSISIQAALARDDVYGNTVANYDGMADLTGSNGIISADPGFVDRALGNLRLLSGSPCIDAGDDSAVIGLLDLDGRPRISGPHVDIGAYEFGAARYVATTGNDANDGSSWIKAKRTVGGALAVAQSGDEVWVAKGNYVENVNVAGSVALYGGFAGTETSRDQRDWKTNQTALDGNGNTGYWYGVVKATGQGVVLDGFTIGHHDCGIDVYGSTTVTNCTVSRNAYFGITMYGGTANISNCAFSANSADGIYFWNAATANIANCTFRGNLNGGAVYHGTASFTNCEFSANTNDGIDSNGILALTNCTFSQNGLAGVSIGGGPAIITNCIVAYNYYGIHRALTTISVTLSHNDVYGSTVANYSGIDSPEGMNGNISADPLFVNRASGNLRLTAGSPCIDAGDNSAVIGTLDLDGRPRISGSHVDMGAYESNQTRDIIRVWASSPGPAHDGTTWNTAFRTVQAATDIAGDGDEVWVARGTYVENVSIATSIALYGGFAGTETARSQRDWNTNVTVLDGKGSTTADVVTSVDGGVLDGLSILNAGSFRAGIQANSGTTTVTNCTVSGNGYAVEVAYTGNAIVSNCTFSGNHSGISSPYSSSTVTNCTFSANGSAVDVGGASNVTNCTFIGNGIGLQPSGVATVANCTISGGYTGINPSGHPNVITNCDICGNSYGVDIISGSATVTNCAISGNAIAGVETWGEADITNCTISNNGTGVGCGGANVFRGVAAITNCIVASNTTGISRSADNLDVALSHTDVYGNTSGNYVGMPDQTGVNGNISADPLFVDLTSGVLRLASGSPCIDAGDDSVVPAGALDLNGRPRISGAHVDMGAYEFGAAKYVATTGNDANDGSSWSKAKRTVGSALAVAQSGDEVWVAKGTYVQTLTSSGSVALCGGFAGTETARNQRNWQTNATILDGGGPDNVVLTSSGPAFVLDGFTVRNGVSSVSASSGTATVINCTITGCYYALMGVNTISNSTITGNTTGIWYATTVNNCVIAGNGDPIISAANVTNCVISGNSGCSNATTVTNCTIVGNAVCGVTAGTVTNCIVAFNDIGISTTGTTVAHYNDVFGNTTANYRGTPDQTGLNGNISVDPLFVNRAGDNLRLLSGSPCIQAGDDSVVTTGETDLDGKPRIIGAHVDIGAYEYGAVRYVATTGNDANDGASWSTAKRTVPGALAVAQAGDELWVAQGTYPGSVTFPVGLALYGGFAGTETARTQRSWAANVTTLDGGVDLGTYSFGLWSAKALDGFTLQNGSLTGNHYGPLSLAHCEFNAYPISIGEVRGLSIADCRIEGASILVFVYYSGATITSSRITDSPTHILADGDTTISDNTVTNSQMRLEGSEGNSKFVMRNAFFGSGVDLGGGLNAVVDRNAFSGSGGTALIVGLSHIVISNNCVSGYDTAITGFPGGTTVGNTLVANGTALDVSAVNNLFANNIIAFNAHAGVEEYGTYHNNCFFGNVYLLRDEYVHNPIGVDGNISADPRFVNRIGGVYRLQSGSPCINVGDDSAVPPGGADLDGKPRIVGAHVDIGAYEFDGTTSQYTLPEAIAALKAAGGLVTVPAADMARLDVSAGVSAGVIDILDAVRIARKVAGLDANP